MAETALASIIVVVAAFAAVLVMVAPVTSEVAVGVAVVSTVVSTSVIVRSAGWAVGSEGGSCLLCWLLVAVADSFDVFDPMKVVAESAVAVISSLVGVVVLAFLRRTGLSAVVAD